MRDSFDNNIDDEAGYGGDDLQQDNETQKEDRIMGFVKEKLRRTVDEVTVSADALDSDKLPEPESEQEQIELRRGKTAEDDEDKIPELPRAVAPKTAKQQVKDKHAAAKAQFKYSEKPKQPANDNFKPTVSWPLMDQLTRSTFEPDKERRAKYAVSARYVRELIDTVEADSLGSSVHLPGKDTSADYGVQRTESGNVYFEHGQSLDRRQATISDGDVRHIGAPCPVVALRCAPPARRDISRLPLRRPATAATQADGRHRVTSIRSAGRCSVVRIRNAGRLGCCG
jgi:hypothetical protein